MWFSYIMVSSRVDHKDETDGKRNLDCAGKGLFITPSSRRAAGGPPERRNHRELTFIKSWLRTPIVQSSVQFRKMLLFSCGSSEDVNHSTENQELLCFLVRGNFIICGRFFSG